VEENDTIRMRIDLEFRNALLGRFHAVFGLVSRILDESVENVNGRVKENNLFENHGFSLIQHDVDHRAIIADDVDFVLVVFAVENQAWDCDRH